VPQTRPNLRGDIKKKELRQMKNYTTQGLTTERGTVGMEEEVAIEAIKRQKKKGFMKKYECAHWGEFPRPPRRNVLHKRGKKTSTREHICGGKEGFLYVTERDIRENLTDLKETKQPSDHCQGIKPRIEQSTTFPKGEGRMNGFPRRENCVWK